MSNLSDNLEKAVGETPLGATFTRIAPRRWTRDRDAFREVFEFEAMKGASYSARWGIDLPICPRLRSKRLSSKLRAEQAYPDLILDPIDLHGDIQSWHSVSDLDRPSIGDLKVLAQATTRAALAELEPVAGLAGLRALFEKRAGMTFRRFGPEDYAQTDLCWGLVCYALNDSVAAAEHIARFCERFEIAPDTPALVRATKAATALSETKQ